VEFGDQFIGETGFASAEFNHAASGQKGAWAMIEASNAA
jgi:hypothetical protein